MTDTIGLGGRAAVARQRYLDQLTPWLDAPVVKVLRGVRRCGKSVLLRQLEDALLGRGVPRDRILLINFESLANAALCDHRALYEHVIRWAALGTGRVHLLLDEVQLVDQWERAVNSLRIDLDCDIVVTGSNAWLLSTELATLLTGRYVEIDVYPFAFDEYCDLVRATEPAAKVADLFRRYLDIGGMPGAHELNDQAAAMTYLRDVSSGILLKDVVARKKLRDVDLLERLLAFVMDNLGRTFSARRVSDFLKSQRRSLGSETVYNYLHALTEACLVHKAERLDVLGRRLMETQEKYYLADHGFVHSWLGHRPDETPGILENITYLELRRRGYEVRIGKADEREIDFVADRAGTRLYLQVCYLLADPSTVDREFAPLQAIADNHRKVVLSLDEGPRSDRFGMERWYLPEFLLNHGW